MVGATDEAVRQRVRDILVGYVGHQGALLMALLDVQYQLGYIPETTVTDAAEVLGYSEPEVWGVLTFYADFKLGRKANHFIDVCIDTPCHVDGAQRIWQALEAELAKGGDGRPEFELRRTSCPRLCMQAPVIATDQKWLGQMTPDKALDIARKLG